MNNKLVTKQANEIMFWSRTALVAFTKSSQLQLNTSQQEMFLAGFAGGLITERFKGKDTQELNDIIVRKIFVE